MSERLGCLRDERGFTLVELMAVVLIISILVGIAMVSFILSISAAKETTCKANLRIINEMSISYRAEYGHWPATLNDLVPDYVRDAKSLQCPESGQPYDYDPGTGQATCPTCPP